MSLQLSSKQPIADVWIAQLDRKRVPQLRSSGCKSSVAVTVVCSWNHASRNCVASSLRFHWVCAYRTPNTKRWMPSMLRDATALLCAVGAFPHDLLHSSDRRPLYPVYGLKVAAGSANCRRRLPLLSRPLRVSALDHVKEPLRMWGAGHAGIASPVHWTNERRRFLWRSH